MEKMSLLDLPNELIYVIGEFLPTQGSVRNLMIAHRRFNNLLPLQERLYDLTPPEKYLVVLLFACEDGRKDLTRAMLRHQNDGLPQGRYPNKDPLCRAARKGHTDIVSCLLEHDPTVVHSWSWLNEALISAMLGDHLEIVDILLNTASPAPKREHKAWEMGPSRVRSDQPALDCTLLHGKENFVRMLSADNRFSLGPQSLSHAAGGGKESLVRLCLEKAPPRSPYDGRLPLCSAAERGHPEIVKILLEEGNEDPTRSHRSRSLPLHLAASSFRNSAETVKVLIERSDVDPDARDINKATPLSLAARRGNVEAMRLLFDTGKVDIDSLDSYHRTPLSHAAGNGHVEAVRFLLDTGLVDPNSKDSADRTPLSRAAESGHVAVVKALLATGKVKPDLPDCDGRTPLSYAAGSSCHTSNTNELYRGSDEWKPASKDMRRVLEGEAPLTPSVEASKQQDKLGREDPNSERLIRQDPLGVIEQLLQQDAVKPDSRDNTGKTPLMFAVEARQMDAVRMLMDTGKVDLNLRDEDGWSVWMYADMGGAE